MKGLKQYCFVTALLFAGATVNAQLPGKVELPDKVYEGTAIPTESGWTELRMDLTVNDIAGSVDATSVADGSLKLKAGEAGKFTQLEWYKTGLTADASTGYTIEIKAKINEAKKYGAFKVEGFDQFGKGFRIGIYEDYLAATTNPLLPKTTIANALDNSDAFHTYRFAVGADGTVTVFRDGAKLGEFPISAFYFDNIVENGSFEENDFSAWEVVKGAIQVDTRDKTSGNQSMYATNTPLAATTENLTLKYPAIPMRVGPAYSISYNFKKTDPIIEGNNWRDFDMGPGGYGSFWRENTTTDNVWQYKNAIWSGGLYNGANVLNKIHFSQKASAALESNTFFDDFYVYERTKPVGKESVNRDPYPYYAVNLIDNPGFEDPTGWEIGGFENNPAKRMEEQGWYCRVRLQTSHKNDDTPREQIAHSGKYSLRYSSFNQEQLLDYRKQLEAGKTYRFVMWYRAANYNDTNWLYVYNGDDQKWKENINGRNTWNKIDITFTTDETNKELRLASSKTSTEGSKGWHNTYFDDMMLYEVKPELENPITDPYAGYTNLFTNGGFENENQDIFGDPYTWSLASQREVDSYVEDETTKYRYSDNYPVAYNDNWNAYLRLQDVQKGDDTGDTWAHNGTKSLRVSYLNNAWNDGTTFKDYAAANSLFNIGDSDAPWNQNLDFIYELEANKTYAFVFWIRSANYPDVGKVFVANGDYNLWGGTLGNFTTWVRKEFKFTTTETNKTLRFYTEFTNWYNFYLDDLALYELDYEPLESDLYLAFGKTNGLQSTDVEIEYLAFDGSGAYAPAATATAWTGAVSTAWNDPDNWTNGVIQAYGQDISFAENVSLPLVLDGAFEVNNLDLTNASDSKFLNLAPGASLKVTGTLTGVTEETLNIDARSGSASGSFIYPQDQTAAATIAMGIKAFTDNDAAAGSKYHWQYIATAVDQLDVNPAFDGTALRYWNEAGTGNEYWKGVANGDKLVKFKGYEITAPAATGITYSGQLINEDFNSGAMTFTAGAAFPGQYILGNSYTAAVKVSEIDFGSAMEETVYLFNTGNYTQSASGSVGNDAGQYTAIPKNRGGQAGLPDRIPSLQSYLVLTQDDTNPTGDITIAIDYDKAVAANNAPMRNADISNYAIVTLESDNFSDKLWLFLGDEFSRGFDNGFDGKKFVDMSSAAQVYAVESDGTYQVNSIPALNGTTLGFLANELDSEYTLTFEYFGIEGNDQILLRDKLTGEVINITAEGSTYTFTASGAAKANRFELITRDITALDVVENFELDAYVQGNSIVVKQNELLNGTIAIYDMSGKLLLQEAFAALETTIATDLATGSYIVRLANEKTAVSKKVSIVK